MCVYTPGGRPRQWWKENVAALERLNNLTVMNLSSEGPGRPASHSVRWSCTARSKTGKLMIPAMEYKRPRSIGDLESDGHDAVNEAE